MLSPATNDPNLSSSRIMSAQCAGRSDALFETNRRTTRYPSGTRAHSACRPTQKRPDPKVEALRSVDLGWIALLPLCRLIGETRPLKSAAPGS